MSFLREMGLAAALLAATGGAAIATWNYISARRRKEAGQDGDPDHRTAVLAHREEAQPSPISPDSEKQKGEQKTGPQGALLVLEHAEGAQTEGASVQEAGGDAYSECTVQREKAASSECTVKEEEAASSACTVQEEAAASSACTVQEEEAASSACTVQEEKAASSACTVQRDKEVQAESSVQVEGDTASSTCTVQVREETAGSVYTEGQVEGTYAVQEDRRELLTSPMEPPVLKELSDSNTEMQAQVRTSLHKQVVVLGLDGSGKTSVLNSIAANKGKVVTTPTEGVNAVCVNNGNSKMEFLEIGGGEHLRPYWKMYLSKAFAVIFVVDSADHERLPLAKRHLHQLIQHDAIVPLMVFANKQDLKNAYHITEIHEALGLSDICEHRKLFLIGTYVAKDESDVSSGILDAKEFLAQLLSESSTKRP
ncbi:ADP-ribosylation factor-like protein 9 isoform X2 [Pyxicephalus adspersus]|uniref:ADP-ribosylation factor-like protein 9 isoform X2 n=1 Tax=Pyxicephalus adspersus TaxID=30357 RepID=UPI003B5B8022